MTVYRTQAERFIEQIELAIIEQQKRRLEKSGADPRTPLPRTPLLSTPLLKTLELIDWKSVGLLEHGDRVQVVPAAFSDTVEIQVSCIRRRAYGIAAIPLKELMLADDKVTTARLISDAMQRADEELGKLLCGDDGSDDDGGEQ